jgi:hypothetical protein
MNPAGIVLAAAVAVVTAPPVNALTEHGTAVLVAVVT